MAILASETLLRENKKSSNKMLPIVGIEPGLVITSDSNTFYTNLTFACKTESLGSLSGHALLILTESSKFKNQVVHK